MARSRLEAVGSAGLTPLVGREQEIGLLPSAGRRSRTASGRWCCSAAKRASANRASSRCCRTQVAAEPQAWLTPCQCSPYHQHTALYPRIDLLERVALRFEREESPQQKLGKLEGSWYSMACRWRRPCPSLPPSSPCRCRRTMPLPMSPEQQKQQTLHVLLTILLRIAAQQPVLFVMEDLHWVDPSTLEFLSLLVDQGPTARILALFTFRPDFSPPWTGRSHLTQVTLPRLPRTPGRRGDRPGGPRQAAPPEVVEQIVAKTDGAALFVEELTKMVLESGCSRSGRSAMR